jgi:hypothetical protein
MPHNACLGAASVRRVDLVRVCTDHPRMLGTVEVLPFPSGFRTQEIKSEGATIHVRVGGQGPAIVMLHGFGDTGDMWAPLARRSPPTALS